MKILRTASLLFLAACLFSLHAQEASSPGDKPPVPRLAPAQAMSGWTVQYQYKQPDPYPKTSNPIDAEIFERMRKNNPRLTTLQVAKADDRKKKVESYADGSETLTWFVGDYLVMNRRVSHIISVGTVKQTDFNFRQDFYELAWVEKADYEGRHEYQGVNCYVYKATDPGTGGETTAYINVATGLPQAVETGDAILSYHFAPSSDSLEVPNDIAQRITSYQQSLIKKPF
jgi:hypothetical protein